MKNKSNLKKITLTLIDSKIDTYFQSDKCKVDVFRKYTKRNNYNCPVQYVTIIERQKMNEGKRTKTDLISVWLDGTEYEKKKLALHIAEKRTGHRYRNYGDMKSFVKRMLGAC